MKEKLLYVVLCFLIPVVVSAQKDLGGEKYIISSVKTGTSDQYRIAIFSNNVVSRIRVSGNGGSNWTDIDGNLPEMPIYFCMFYPGDNTKAIIATEKGIWQANMVNGMSTIWTVNSDFPLIRFDMLQYSSATRTLTATTHNDGSFFAKVPLCTAPPISVTPGSSLICNPGGAAITLTAMGATTYVWTPSTGLSATTGSVVTANPASTTTYTITGTDDFGCTAVTTATVTVGNKPVLAPTATPSTICSGASSTLNANATMPALTYCTPTYTTGTGQGDYISLVQILTTTLNNPTAGAASPYYTLFPASGSTTASLAANTAYTMTVKGGTFGTCFIRGWIDYNQDGIFTAAESIGISPNVGASTSGNIVFTPPLSAINGATRLRLRTSDTSPGPATGDFCGATNSAFGETEDYVVTITGAVAQFTYLWSPATFLSSTTTNPTTASSVTSTTAYNLTVTAPTTCNATSNVTVTINTITVTNPATTTGSTGVAFSQTFTQSGAISGATFTINSGTLPTGLSLSTAGVLSGTPTQSGTFPITVKVTGGNTCFGIGATYTLVISGGCPTITVTNPATTTGTAGTAFSQTFTQTGAVGGATFTINTGTLPTGLSLSAAGVLSGTPTQTGTFPITVKVTDGNSCIGTGSTYTLVIGCQTITVTNPGTTTGTAGTAFSQTFTQSGSIGGSTFTINTGSLPTGLSLSAAGVLSGTPTQTGSFPITVKVTDGNGCTGIGATYTLVIGCQTITVTNPGTTTGTAGTAFSQTFTQSGSIGGSTFTINTGSLPTGLSLSAAGVLSGTPTQTGSFPITVKVTDGNGCTGIGATYTLVIGCQTITVTNPGTTTGTAGTAFSQTFTQSGSIGGPTFTINTGSLPTGLSLSAAGVLSGTPTQAGSFPITVKVTDGNGCTGIGATYTLVINCPTITVTNPGTTTGTAGTAFSQTFTQTGATGGATFSLNSGSLPTGLSLSAAGVLSGTPTQTGSFPIIVKVTSGHGCIGTGSTYTLVIGCQTITVTNPGTTTGTANAAFSQTFTQSGSIGGATFTINTGSLPTGLSLSAAGVLSGTPTQTGSFPITVKVTDGNGCTGIGATYTLVIGCQTITVTNPGTTTGTANAAFSQTFTQSGSIGGSTFTINTGSLPTGLSLSAAGVLSGTPTQTGSFPITVKVTDGNGCTGIGATYTLVIGCQTITVTNPGTTTGTANAAFSQTFTQSGSIGGSTFTINTGILPTGLSLSAAGVLSGTPTQTGSFPITVKVTDGNGCTGIGATYTLVIGCQTITVTNPGTTTGTANTAFNQTFTQSGSIGGSTFTINTGSLPTGLSLSAAGVLSGTPTQTGSFPITVKVTDGNGCTGIGATYTLVIGCQTITVTNPGTTTGTAGTAFSQTFTQSGSIGGSTFTINTGTLPTGLSLSAAGVLSGTPTQTGSFPITVKVTDGNGCTGIGATYTLVIGCQTITVTNPGTTTGTVGTAFSQTFTQSGSIGGSTFTINTGSLPTGLSLSVAGVLSGTPTQTGSFPITVKVTDGNGCTGIGATYTLVIGSATITVNLKLFLQGYYLNGGSMQPVLNNQSVPSSLPNETDSISIDLHHPTTFALIDSKKAVLLTNGTVSVSFTQPAGSYFIGIRHRNTVQTWSANAIACTASTALYDFSTLNNKSFGDNQVQVEAGVWAFYTGDLNQDEFIDVSDYPDFDNDNLNGVSGVYVSTDMNGDGFVDVSDYPVFDNNNLNGVASIHP